VSSDFQCITNHPEVLKHDYQVLLHIDQHVWGTLYLKIISGLVNIMGTDDVLENSEYHEYHAHVSRARSLWIVSCHP